MYSSFFISFLTFLSTSNVPCHHYRHRHLRFHCLFSCRLSLSLRRRANGGIRNWRRDATTDFLGFFLLRENQRHLNLTRAFTSTRRVRLLFKRNWCTGGSGFVLLGKDVYLLFFRLTLEFSANFKPSGNLLNYTVHPKPDRAPNCGGFQMHQKH